MAKKTNILHFSRWALIWLGLFLGFCGFGIYLGGVAALQQVSTVAKTPVLLSACPQSCQGTIKPHHLVAVVQHSPS